MAAAGGGRLEAESMYCLGGKWGRVDAAEFGSEVGCGEKDSIRRLAICPHGDTIGIRICSYEMQ